MSDDQRRHHALLLRDLGPHGLVFVPLVGQVFWVSSLLYSSRDPAPGRPAVVVAVPFRASATARIQIVTRTSKPGVAGVAHGRDPGLDLDRSGVFSDLVSCLALSWRPGNVLLAGQLPEPYLARVMERFG